jgi:hypothetical protein
MTGVSETVRGLASGDYGDYGPVNVEMHDTIGAIGLAIVSVLLLWALLRQQALNRALTETLVRQRESLVG